MLEGLSPWSARVNWNFCNKVGVRNTDAWRHREQKRAKDLTSGDSCTDNFMQFRKRTSMTDSGFMRIRQNTDTELLFGMSQQDLCPCGEPTLEQSIPEGLCPVKRTHAGAVREEVQPVGRTHIGEVREGLSPVGRIPRWSRGRA
ncbi:uncharacterized protein WM294_016059 isoform 2-T6 [Sarcoramphus papa]